MFGWAVLVAVNLTKLSWVGRVCVLPCREEKAACVKQITEREPCVWTEGLARV